MEVSLIVPTHDKRALLARTIASLERLEFDAGRFEVVVVDDASTDDTPAFLAAYSGPLRLIRLRQESNRGRAAARNAALRAAGGELILFLDDDMEVAPGFLAAHVEHHRAGRDRVGIGDVVNAPEIHDSPVVRYMSSRGAQKIRAGGPLPWRYFSTNNSSVRREHLAAVGFFDEEFRTYGFEDLELGYRLFRERGLAFGFVEGARSLHIHYHSLEDVLAKKYLSGRHSLLVFLRRHPEARREIPLLRCEAPRPGDPAGTVLGKLLVRPLLTPFVHRLIRPLARFDWGALSDWIFDYLVTYQTLRGLKDAEIEAARAPREPTPDQRPGTDRAAAAS